MSVGLYFPTNQLNKSSKPSGLTRPELKNKKISSPSEVVKRHEDGSASSIGNCNTPNSLGCIFAGQ
jgi:hypothetical protein